MGLCQLTARLCSCRMAALGRDLAQAPEAAPPEAAIAIDIMRVHVMTLNGPRGNLWSSFFPQASLSPLDDVSRTVLGLLWRNRRCLGGI